MHKIKAILAFIRQHFVVLSILPLILLITASGWIFWNEAIPPKDVRCNSKTQSISPQTDKIPERSLPSPLQPDLVNTRGNYMPGNLASRPGFGLSTQADAAQWSQELHDAWYLDWDIRLTRNFDKPEHWQMIRLSAGCISPRSILSVGWLCATREMSGSLAMSRM